MNVRYLPSITATPRARHMNKCLVAHERVHAVKSIRSRDRLTTLNDAHAYHDNGDHEQNVNKTTHGVRRFHSTSPKHYQDGCDGREHRRNLRRVGVSADAGGRASEHIVAIAEPPFTESPVWDHSARAMPRVHSDDHSVTLELLEHNREQQTIVPFATDSLHHRRVNTSITFERV